jgi:hypothetical protein
VDDRGQHPVLLALGAGLVAAALLACAALAVTSRRAPVTRAGDTR